MFTTFIGSSSEARKPYAEDVARIIGEHPLFEPLPWWDDSIARAGTSFFHSLVDLLERTTFAVFVATPDDLLLKRGKRQLSVRDNVLFEYGLFAGHLGRSNAILFQIGSSSLPSDLEGITVVRIDLTNCHNPRERSKKLRAGVRKGLDDLLQTSDDDLDSTFRELRDGKSYLKPETIRPLLAKVVRKRVDAYAAANLSQHDLQHLLEKYRRGEQLVGQSGHLTKVQHFFDLSKTEGDELRKISASYARFASKQLIGNGSDECATRVVLHYKRDLRLLSKVVAMLGIRPAIVDLETGRSRRVKGRCMRGEQAIMLHDFTTSGFTPLECIAEMRAREVNIRKLITFFAREENIERIQTLCSDHDLEFHVFCVEKTTGELELQGNK